MHPVTYGAVIKHLATRDGAPEELKALDISLGGLFPTKQRRGIVHLVVGDFNTQAREIASGNLKTIGIIHEVLMISTMYQSSPPEKRY